MSDGPMLTKRSQQARDREMRPHYVYQLWSTRECIYIGVTSNIGQRLTAHARKDWWLDVRRMVVDTHPDRYSGLDAERDLIQEHSPWANTLSVL